MYSFAKYLVASIACAALVAPAAAAKAQVEATPIPIPKPNLSAINYFSGTWSCSLKSSRRPSAYAFTVASAFDPTGWWLNSKTSTPAMKWFPHAATTYDKYTYDPSAKRWVDITYGDYGAYGMSTSPGWHGNRWTWHALGFVPSNGIKSQSDTTITKTSATRFAMDSWFTESSGRKVTVHGTCAKRR